MFPVIIALAAIVGVINMGFEQGQQNPDASSFFSSSASVTRAE